MMCGGKCAEDCSKMKSSDCSAISCCKHCKKASKIKYARKKKKETHDNEDRVARRRGTFTPEYD
jgi:hypothetical protein